MKIKTGNQAIRPYSMVSKKINITAKKIITFVFLMIFICVLSINKVQAQGSNNKQDAFQTALDSLGISQDDIGYKPKTYWLKYPQQVPYKFIAFDDLFAEPLKLYDYSKTMSNIVSEFLKPEVFAKSSNVMFKLVQSLSIDRYIGSNRGYGANIIKQINANDTNALSDALKNIYTICNKETTGRSFEDTYQSKNIFDTQIKDKFSSLPLEIKVSLTKLIINLTDAYRWRQIAVRNVSPKDMQRVFHIRDLAFTQGDGNIYYPEFDDIMKTIDLQSLYYSSQKVVASTDLFRYEVDSLLKNRKEYKLDNLNISIETPLGIIQIKGSGKDTHNVINPFIIIDLGGEDTYTGVVGANSSPEYPISVCLDFRGDDKYINKQVGIATQGAGIFGTGILLDLEGNDTYISENYSQGLGIFGIGLLLDIKGNDEYNMENSGQGCGYFGIGLNFDATGNDKFYFYGDGQGMGGVNGIGVLANYSGNDEYIAEPDSKVFNRGDYHSGKSINLNNAQGAGYGRRGDGSDGHNWAGGIGAIIDIKGDDRYISGNFSLGIGYWFGLGIVYDNEGNDYYKSNYFTHASAAHFAMGVLIDEKGNDKHIVEQGAGISFGWDWTNTLLIDKQGDDLYQAKTISIANAALRSNSLLFDLEGNDTYKFGNEDNSMGTASHTGSFESPSLVSTYFYEGTQVAILTDVSGDDKYIDFDNKKSENLKNNSFRLNPKKEEASKYRNFGIFFDFENAEINLFDSW